MDSENTRQYQEANSHAPSDSIWKHLKAATNEFAQMADSFDSVEINTIPYTGSWTAAQVVEHVKRSNNGIAKELAKEGKNCDRAPDAGVENLKKTFLDFDRKLQSPDFILPTKDQYSKAELTNELEKSVETLFEGAREKDLTMEISHAIFGNVTKLELLYFVVFHTQRHAHQLKKIKTRVAQHSA